MPDRPNLESGKFCYWLNLVPEADGEYRPSIVVEGVSGHYPCDFTYGKDRAAAQQAVDELNARLGVDDRRAMEITTSSMRAQSRERGRRRRS